MNEQDPSAQSENRLSEAEPSLAPRGLSPGTSGARTGGSRQSRQSTTEPKQLKIVVHVGPAEAQPKLTAQVAVGDPVVSQAEPPEGGTPNVQPIAHDPIPARMLTSSFIVSDSFTTNSSRACLSKARIRCAAAFIIEFPDPVSGPIAVGYGSHFGLGLFVPAAQAAIQR